jgi:virginiamycin B lyase
MLSSCLLSLALALPLAAAEKKHYPVEIREWPVPWANSKPRDPHVVSPTSVWFAGEAGNYIATFNPESARFSKVDLTDEPAPSHLIAAAGTKGMIWYSGPARGYIGRYDPVTRTLARFPMPNAAASDPGALVFEAGERNIWFTAEQSNIIGRLRLANGVVDLGALTTQHALPSGIAMAPYAGNPWVALYGTNKLATVDVRTFTLSEHALPRAAARPRRVTFTSDRLLWYSDFAEGYLGSFDPGSKVVQEWPLPQGKSSHPFAIAADSKDRIWLMATGARPTQLLSFDPKTRKFSEATPVPSGGGLISDMSYDAASGTLWFCTDANTIGSAKLN